MQVIQKSFFKKDTVKIAKDLLGCYLIRSLKKKNLIGKIVETEAYLGLKDSACHSFKGLKTKRNVAMYLPGGHSYIYLIYGMHYCFNVVTKEKEKPEAVLIRALEPVSGLLEMQKNRNKNQLESLCSGPGKLCQALSIDLSLNKKKLYEIGPIYLTKRKNYIPLIETDRRIGLPAQKKSSFWPLRFYIKESPFVSVKKK